MEGGEGGIRGVFNGEWRGGGQGVLGRLCVQVFSVPTIRASTRLVNFAKDRQQDMEGQARLGNDRREDKEGQIYT